MILSASILFLPTIGLFCVGSVASPISAGSSNNSLLTSSDVRPPTHNQIWNFVTTGLGKINEQHPLQKFTLGDIYYADVVFGLNIPSYPDPSMGSVYAFRKDYIGEANKNMPGAKWKVRDLDKTDLPDRTLTFDWAEMHEPKIKFERAWDMALAWSTAVEGDGNKLRETVEFLHPIQNSLFEAQDQTFYVFTTLSGAKKIYIGSKIVTIKILDVVLASSS